MTIPDKPKSRLQRYQTTEEGKKWLQSGHQTDTKTDTNRVKKGMVG